MREILFRGKVLYEKYWITGSLYLVDGLAFIIRPHERTLQVDIETVGQYTGLKDKNGKWIFEGDIVYIPRLGKAYEVKYRLGQFFVGINGPIAYERNDCKVLGNIHDNPDLIGGKEE